MATVLKGATLLELEPACVERADLRVEDGRIVARGADAVAREGDEVVDLDGRFVMPGLVSAHHRFYATLLRGLARADDGWAGAERALFALEDALDGDASEAAAAYGALEGVLCGTTAVFDVHSSPAAPVDALSRVARGLGGVGLRGVLGYQVSDRRGALSREEGLEETVAFCRKAKGRVMGAVAAHSPGFLSPDAFAGLQDALARSGAHLLLQLGEDPKEEAASLDRYEQTPCARLLEAGLLGPRTLVAQAVHVAWPELALVQATGAWLVHAARSNMETQTGVASASKFGTRAALGTDVLPLDVFAEAQAAWTRARDAGQPIDVLHWLANGHRLASSVFGLELGPLRPGAAADLVVLDYAPPTPVTAASLGGHFLHGFSPRHVESVMVDGLWRVQRRVPLVDAREVAAAAREAAAAVGARAESRAAAPAGG